MYDPDRKYDTYEYLEDYAKYFNSVEIDQWFWSLFPSAVRLPDAETATRLADSVPTDFKFTVKAPNSITLTHSCAKQPKGSEARANEPNSNFLDVGLLNRFMETIEPMHAKLGVLMFQFEYLNKAKMPSQKAFLDRLHEFFSKAPKGFAYAIELRNPNYLSAEFFDFLKAHVLGCVLLEGYFMPPIAELAARFDVSTAGFLVIRLHGPDRAGMEERTGGVWNRIVEPRDHSLDAAAGLIKANARLEVETYVNVNNHYEGSAPLTIERLAARLSDTKKQAVGAKK